MAGEVGYLKRFEDVMTTKLNEQTDPIEDPNALLEKTLIEEYLHEKGYSREDLKKLPAELVETLMKEATRYASLKMEEVKARANLLHELHEDSSPFKK
jgi:phage shock protein A